MSGISRRYPGLRVSFMTVHGSKGLEADYVVVPGLCSGKYGFPAEIVDDPLLDLVLATPEHYPNAEERRLFYVAITRARRQAFLLADGGPPSPFVLELIEGTYDVVMFGQLPEAVGALPGLREGSSETPREHAGRWSLLRLLELAFVRTQAASMPCMRGRLAGKDRGKVQMP